MVNDPNSKPSVVEIELAIPSLPDPFGQALEACSRAMMSRYDVQAIVACGTIVRRAPDKRSDLDMFVLHRGSFRERVQEFFETVPCEIFVNPTWRIEKYFIDDQKDRRPFAAHMIATGAVIYDPDGVVPAITQLAVESLKCPGTSQALALIESKYHAATLLEDALDLAERDRDAALLLMGAAIKELAEHRVAAEPGWLPRPKDLLTRLREIDPEAATLACQAIGDGMPEVRIESARQLCLRVAGSDGFFPWTSKREELERPIPGSK